MNVEQFIEGYIPQMHEYCPVIIDFAGEVYESTEGHLQTLVSISGNSDILSQVPKDTSPLLYLAGILKCVIVDYENQIYMDSLSDEQEHALQALIDADFITDHRIRMTNEKAKI